MLNELNIDAWFAVIKKNHGLYLRDYMINEVELTGDLKQERLLKEYIDNIGYFRTTKERYLNSALQQINLNSHDQRSALPALLNIGTGKQIFTKLKNITANPLDFINSLNDPEDENSNGTFSNLLNAGTHCIAYESWQTWLRESNQTLGTDFQNFQAALNQAGFTNKKYQMLSTELIKLFHFRECILLGLRNSSGVNLRQEFITRYSRRARFKRIDGALLNTAVETYFMFELNKLFNKAFQDTYDIQDQQIHNEMEQIGILTWIKNFFEKPELRYQFTQQLQVLFMEECINFLEIEMNKLTFSAKHPWLSSLVVGLICGASAALVTALFVVDAPLFLLIIALVTTGLITAIFYWSINQSECLKYKKDQYNRAAIGSTINNVTKECMRINRLMHMVETSSDDVNFLNKYKDRGNFNGWFHLNDGNIKLLGSAKSWLREHASRYRHSRGVEIDLASQHRIIIERADLQTKKLQKKLLNTMTKSTFQSKTLKSMLRNTREFLVNPQNAEFIKKFELIEKIKQQILEIVSATPSPDTLHKKLPDELSKFYTDPVHAGGLGGHKEDLLKVRELAGLSDYNELLECAQGFNFNLTQDQNYDSIFSGDSDCRERLGLSIDNLSDENIQNMSVESVREFLENSWNFLYSLNPPAQARGKINLDTPIQNSNEFVLYRMLLIKQVAKICDPHNLKFDPGVKNEIHQFIKERLYIDPLLVFDDVINQTLFVNHEKVGSKIQGTLNKEHYINDLDWVADAIRLDLAYSSKPITPRMMIYRDANEFILLKDEEQTLIFGHEETNKYLAPESTQIYQNKLEKTILATKEFIHYLHEKSAIKNSGAIDSYVEHCIHEIGTLILQIESLNAMLRSKKRQFNTSFLTDSRHLLLQCKKELSETLPLKENPYSPQIFYKKFIRPTVDIPLPEHKEFKLGAITESSLEKSPKTKSDSSGKFFNLSLLNTNLKGNTLLENPSP